MTDPLLFVSHVSENHTAAMELVQELERRGIPCWIAPRNVQPGEPFDDAIATAIETCRAMLLVFSDHCNRSQYIRREVTFAGDAQKLVIPLRIEKSEAKGGLRMRLSDLHWIDAFAAREQAIDAVVRSVDRNNGRVAVRQPAPVVAPAAAPAAQPSTPRSSPTDDHLAAQRAPPPADAAMLSPLPAPAAPEHGLAEPGPSARPAAGAIPAGLEPIMEVGAGTDPHEAALFALTEEDVATDGWSDEDRALLKRARRNDRDAQYDLGFRYRHGSMPVDKRRADAWMLRAACQGRPGAMRTIGYRYAIGEGVPKNERRAYLWSRKGAENGDRDAQTVLGIYLAEGSGVERDFAQAAHWFRKALDKGDRAAALQLGELYENGRGVERDPVEAMRLYRHVLTLPPVVRPPRAFYLIGRLYEQGLGVPQDFQQAAEWYQKAQGYHEADAAISRLKREYGIVAVAAPYDSELRAIADAEFSTEHWSDEARTTLAKARDGDPPAQWFIGRLFLEGAVGVPPDFTRAAAWLFNAAAGSHRQAQCDLAELFREGNGVVEDGREAFRWEMKAAEQGFAPSQYRVGKALESGWEIGRKEDAFEAAEWYRKAAEQGVGEAQEALGKLYESGKGVAKDPEQAAAWYREAFANGSVAAATSLGRLYENGDGAHQNYQHAADWYARSSDSGAKEALARLKAKHGIVPAYDRPGL